jgi:hypothetical protein
VAEALKNAPGGGFYENPGLGKIKPPLDLIPEGMYSIESRILFDGMIYCITFNKSGLTRNNKI